jgi:hypothetical protein
MRIPLSQHPLLTDMPAFNASLFVNDRKSTEQQPDLTGPGSISKEDFLLIYDQVMAGKYNEGDRGEIKLRVAAWRKESGGGKKYLSLSLSVDDYTPAAVPAVAKANEVLF